MSSRARGWSCGVVLGLLVAMGVLAGVARGDVAVYSHPPNAAGGQYKSSWYAPDGRDDDQHVWDAFTLPSNTAITRVQWRGAYTNYLSGAGQAPVYDFTVAIYASIPALIQPDVVAGPLVSYHVNGNAGETPAGSAGGVAMYDYAFTLPSPFQATAGVKYWVQIEAYQGLTPTFGWSPDWSIARGTGGDNSHFRRVGGTGGSYTSITGDCAFTLLASSEPSSMISVSVTPAGAGTVMGAGSYPNGSIATLIATPNAGFGFLRWSEGGATVGQNPEYSFTVTGPRSITAHFVTAYTVSTDSFPAYGGVTIGGGVYNDGDTVMVTATPAPGFVFSEWTEFGTPVSDAAAYTFPASADTSLTAHFVHAPNTTTFDFDSGPVHTSLPVSLESGGLGGLFSGTAGGYSIQPVGSVGLSPAGFFGNMLYPNSVFAADLVVDFSQVCTGFSIMYSPQELGCDDSARMRATGYLNGVAVGTNTATAPAPGTYPTGTLTLTVPGGFDRVVVHYDAPPPTCHDYGVIFLADNVTVTMRCAAVTIASEPADTTSCPDAGGVFFVGATGSAPISYQWQRETEPGSGVFVDLIDGPTGSWDGNAPGAGGVVSGSNSDMLFIDADTGAGLALGPAHARRYRCAVWNGCGAIESTPARLVVSSADFDGDGDVGTDTDIEAFFACLGGACCATCGTADFNGDGDTGTDADIEAFFRVLGGGSC